MKTFIAATRKLLNRPRVLHYVDIFVAAFAAALLFNKQHLLDAHGLNAVKAVVEASMVTGGKAVLEAYRKSLPPTDTAAPK